MFVIARLFVVAIFIYLFVSLCLNNYDDRKYSIANKIFLFLFVFATNFLFQFFVTITNTKKILLIPLIEISVNNALLAVIAYDVYNDLSYNGLFNSYNNEQKKLILVLLIVGFMTIVKVLQLLINN
jgi:hypothetical protein